MRSLHEPVLKPIPSPCACLPVNNDRLLAAVLAGTGLCRRHKAPFHNLSTTCPDGARTGRRNRVWLSILLYQAKCSLFVCFLFLFFFASTNQCQDRTQSRALRQCGGRSPGGNSSPPYSPRSTYRLRVPGGVGHWEPALNCGGRGVAVPIRGGLYVPSSGRPG